MAARCRKFWNAVSPALRTAGACLLGVDGDVDMDVGMLFMVIFASAGEAT